MAQLPPGVYLEPVPRRPGVALPGNAAQASIANARALGIPLATQFLASRAVPRAGVLKLLVLPALFADSPEPDVSTAEVQRIVFDGPSARPTLPEYYSAASNGRFEVRGAVAPWVRTSVPVADAASSLNGHGWIGEGIGEYVAQAIHAADATIDYGQYDNDGPDGVPNSGDDDGWVDGLVIKTLEVSGACGGPGPWPHFGGARENGAPVVTDDRAPSGARIRVQVYVADSIVDCGGTNIDGPEVIAHETGHLIGLPDLYHAGETPDRENRIWGIGCFDLMSAGAWGCGTGPKVPGYGPTLLSPLMKERLGWLTFEDVESADHREFVLQPAQSSTSALRVRLGPGSLESFIFEYRPATGLDADLPAGGILVYHTDTFQGTRPVPPTLPPPFAYHLVEADGDLALRRSEVDGGNRGAAGDVFARDGGTATLDDATTPSTRDHLGATTTLVVHSMRVANGVARITLSVGGGFRIVSAILPEAVPATLAMDGRIRVGGGMAPYTATLVGGGLPTGVGAAMAGDTLRITGAPLDLGDFTASYVFRDATGKETSTTVRFTIEDLQIESQMLMNALRTPSVLAPNQRDYLDRAGNRNGRLDVGDVRAYLIRTGAVR
jgi:M6 family metalloprotease-like protein